VSTYLWTSIALFAISAVGKLIWLAQGEFPKRNPHHEAIDVAIAVVWIMWAALLLASQ